MMEAQDTVTDRASRRDAAPPGPSVGWAAGTLLLTAFVGVFAKTFGVLVAPGMRGVASQKTMEATELLSASLGYTFAAFLVALICGGSFELARARKIGVVSRGSVVAISGLVVALASPAVVQRLHTMAALALAGVTSLIVIAAGLTTLRAAHTRALGAILTMLALAGILRPVAWQLTVLAGERASMSLYQTSRTVATVAVVVHALAALLGAAWLGTRSAWRGRFLANAAVVAAFGVTYLAARDSAGAPSALQAVLRGALAPSTFPLPLGLASISAFLVPVSILLALVALVQRAQPPAVLAALALGLLSHGSFDVPLQALAITAAAQWAMLAMVDDRSMWSALVAGREASREPATR